MKSLNVLYVSTLCSGRTFARIFASSSVRPQQQAQKFHSLLVKGLAAAGVKVDALSRPPVDHLNDQVFDIDGVEIDKEDGGVSFRYLNVRGFSFLRHLRMFFDSFFWTIRWSFNNRSSDRFLICDVLNLSVSAGAFFAARLLGLRTVAVVTDLPDFLIFNRDALDFSSRVRSSIYKKLSNLVVEKYDLYMVLTEDINRVVNVRRVPHVVIEGMVDAGMKALPNEIGNKYSERVVLYAGALYEKFGVGTLLQAFRTLPDENFRLWIYGAGDMEREIREAERSDCRIKYFGVVPNPEVVAEQLKVSLLINPRPSKEEFTRFSFPSKNMECMVSGTPLLTTRLPGMPCEYFPYVYFFDDESVSGMARTLSTILRLPIDELHQMGLSAKQFVIENKNNEIQAIALLRMLRSSLN